MEAKKLSDEQTKLQDSRPLDELLSFIETKPGGSKHDQGEGHRCGAWMLLPWMPAANAEH